MDVRPATLDDLEVLLRLGIEMHATSLYEGILLDLDMTALWFEQAIEEPTWLCLVAEDGGEIIGMMVANVTTYFFGPERIANEKLVYVRQGKRGGVAAKRLISAYRDWAARRNCREATLSSSTGTDVSAFYTRLGFGQVGTVHKARLGGG